MKHYFYILLAILIVGCTSEDKKYIPTETPEGMHVDDRDSYWKSRFGGKPNIEAFRKGEKEIRQILKKESITLRDGGIMSWEELGPSNIGGRIRAIAAHPSSNDIVLIGAAAGGVWKSEDKGNTWALKTPYYSSYPVSSIAYDPFDDDDVYATTGEFFGGGPEFAGVGVLKSTDGGESWIELPDPEGNDSLWLSKIAMNPLKSMSFYVGGSSSGIPNSVSGGRLYRTDDGGQTWSTILGSIPPLTVGANISDITIDPQDTSHIVIGTNMTALESFDSGQNWTDIISTSNIPPLDSITNPGGRCEVEMTEVNGTSYITLSRYSRVSGGLYRSELWQSVSGSGVYTSLVSVQNSSSNKSLLPFGTQGQYDQVIWVDPNDESRVIWGGLDMWKYDNGTNTRISKWQADIGGSAGSGGNNSIHADQHVITPASGYNGNGNNKVWIGNDGGIYATNNIWTVTESSGWFAKNEGLNITQLYGADVSHNGLVAVGGAQDNSYFYNNNVNSTTEYEQPTTGDGGKCKVHKVDNNILYTSTQFGTTYKSTDGGVTFCPILNLQADSIFVGTNICGNNLSNYIQSSVPFIAPMEISPQNSDVIFVGGVNVFKSEDQGENWDYVNLEVSGVEINAISVFDQDDDIICVGTSTGRIELTTDGGDNWSLIGNNLNNEIILEYPVTDVVINPNNSDQILVSLGKPGKPQDEITNGNLWLTSDGGNTWTDVSPNQFLHIETVTWSPTQLNWIYIGTNAGLLSSEDLGASWNTTPLISGESDGPVLTLITELFWQGDGSDATPYYLCAATHGRGLWRTKFPVRKKHYVDKNCSPCGTGSFDRPYKFIRNALAAAGSGSIIVFKTGGIYDEVPSTIFTNDRIKIEFLDSSVDPVLIK